MHLRSLLHLLFLPSAIITLMLTPLALSGQTGPAQTGVASAHPEEFLRAAYYRSDEETMARDGRALASAKGASPETRAWYAITRFNGILVPQGLAILDTMRADAPDDPWTLVIRSYATGDLDQSIAFCEKAWAKDPREDLVALCTFGIARQMRDEAGAKRLRAFFEQNKSKYEASARTLTAEAEAIQLGGWWGYDNKAMDDSAAVFDRALAIDPHNFRALMGKSGCLGIKHQDKEILAMLEASPWAKESQDWHSTFYRVLEKLDELKKPERVKQVEADGRELIERGEPDQGVLGGLVYDLYKGSVPKAAAEIVDLVLKKYPDTPAAEVALMEKATEKFGADSGGEKASPEVRSEVVKNVLAFLNRPGPRDFGAEYQAAGTLSQIFENERPTADQLLSAVKALGYLRGTGFAMDLALRNEQMFQLGQVAEQRISEMVQLSGTRGTTWHYEIADSDVRNYWSTLGQWYSVLGYTDLKQGKLKQAEENLVTAEVLLDRPASKKRPETYLSYSPETLTFLGALYTEKGDYTKAEEYLGRSISANYDSPEEHPAIAAYKELYMREHGNSEGLEQYMAKTYETDRTRRKSQILKTRLPEPKAVEPFKLAMLGSKKIVSLEDLKGKFAVINFWGTWCGPCKGEMPELQKFYEKYKDNPNVVVLTIDSGDTADVVSKFIADKKYTMPVLFDTDYTVKGGVSGFPTTWFLGPDGKRIFEKTGSSRHLLEEFTWRVEGMTEMAAAKPAEAKTQ